MTQNRFVLLIRSIMKVKEKYHNLDDNNDDLCQIDNNKND